jgi:UDP-4-amino-4,6-dideoxy-N-acetyl-beta-L-altrosamine transaminase
MSKFPYSRPDVTNADIIAVKKSLKNQFLTGGPIIKNFEKKIEEEYDVNNAIVCNSGTAALHLIYLSLGLKKGDTILTSPITFVATANAALMCGANVVFSDVDPLTGMLTPQNIEKELKKKREKIKIITVVHLGGRLCDLEGISKVAKKYNCFIVEDACHAPGAIYYNKKNIGSKVGSCKFSVAASFSFHAIKHVTMAEGGCVTTNDNKLTKFMRLKLNHGIIRKDNNNKNNKKFLDPWYYQIKELGYNYRSSELNCALGLSQIKRLKLSINKRKRIADIYKKELKGITSITFPKYTLNLNSNAWHLFTIFINFKELGIKKRDFIKQLESKDIGTQVHYIPLFLQPIYKSMDKKKFKGALEYYEKSLSLPMYISLKKNDIIYICDIIKKVVFNGKKNILKKQKP